MVDRNENRLVEKQDLVYIVILMAIGLAIGVYIIASTVLIAKDGVFNIECAQKLSDNPSTVTMHIPPGYPFLILMAHRFVMLFTNSTSNQTWIYSAQSVTLLCRLLALIPLYFIGKLLVGGKNSFLGLLVLIMLPYPIEFGSEAIRE